MRDPSGLKPAENVNLVEPRVRGVRVAKSTIQVVRPSQTSKVVSSEATATFGSDAGGVANCRRPTTAVRSPVDRSTRYVSTPEAGVPISIWVTPVLPRNWMLEGRIADAT